ncbi:MAG TPA: helix-turn-helix domain-containing protein [Gemmatimonadaceae bacterium]|jgi:putative transcriptional regulator
MTRPRKKQSIGTQIIEGLEQAIAFEQGRLAGVRSKRVGLTALAAEAVPAPRYTSRHIAKLRTRLNISQSVFAMVLNVSPETVRAWEQGKRSPDGAAARLLEVADRHPDWLLENIRHRNVPAQ